MESELPGVLTLWLSTEFPHFYFESYHPHGPWYGWIKCKCELKHSAAIARLEFDKICLIGANKYYTREHELECADRKNEMNCYCGEKVISIYDNVGFANLKKLLTKTHNRLVRNKEKQLPLGEAR